MAKKSITINKILCKEIKKSYPIWVAHKYIIKEISLADLFYCWYWIKANPPFQDYEYERGRIY